MGDDLLAAGRLAIQSGQREHARQLLAQFIRTNPNSGEAWYFLSEALDEPAQKRECLNRAVAKGYAPPEPEPESVPPVVIPVVEPQRPEPLKPKPAQSPELARAPKKPTLAPISQNATPPPPKPSAAGFSKELPMDLIDRIRDLAARIPKQVDHIQTEEATKNAFIMPFIAALGYDVFNPMEVTPELNADIGIKKGEKVDYAILRDGKPIMLFECKHHAADLSKEHASQLYRYFSVTTARFGVLTNGIHYWFYTDLEAANKMDSRPFFEFNMLNAREQDVEELKKFTKAAFDVSGILTTASELKYTREIKRIMAEQLADPSEEFVKFFAAQVYPGRMTQTVKEQFTATTQRALRQYINDQITERLKTALGTEARITVQDEQATTITTQPTTTVPQQIATDTMVQIEPGVVTTIEEMEAYYVIRAITRDIVDVKRIVIRDKQTYCGILLDDNNRRPICRLWFNSPQKSISLFDNEERKEEKIAIKGIDDLYKHGDRIRATINLYIKPKS